MISIFCNCSFCEHERNKKSVQAKAQKRDSHGRFIHYDINKFNGDNTIAYNDTSPTGRLDKIEKTLADHLFDHYDEGQLKNLKQDYKEIDKLETRIKELEKRIEQQDRFFNGLAKLKKWEKPNQELRKKIANEIYEVMDGKYNLQDAYRITDKILELIK